MKKNNVIPDESLEEVLLLAATDEDLVSRLQKLEELLEDLNTDGEDA